MNKPTTRQRDKLIEAAQNAIEFEVFGKGDFPFDMLRYDLCWPASETDSLHIPLAPTPQARQETRSFNLRGLKLPTVARWASYGWTVVEAS
jgi:hypothetical protein